MGRYDDIIDMEHHTSLRHPRMSLENRAAQFAPFSALTGYEDVIDETGRQTDEFVEPDPMQMQHLNEVMGMIQDRLSSRPMVSGTRFVPMSASREGHSPPSRGMSAILTWNRGRWCWWRVEMCPYPTLWI